MKRSSNSNKVSKQTINAEKSNLINNSGNNINEIIINREKRVFSSAQAKKPIIKDSTKGTSSGKKTDNFQKKSTIFTRNKDASPTRISDIYKSSINNDNRSNDKTDISENIKASPQNNDLRKLISDVNKITIDITKVNDKNSNLRVSDPNRLHLVNEQSKISNKKSIQKK